MQKRLYTMIMHWDVYDKRWSPTCIIEDPQEIYPLLEQWEIDFAQAVKWSTTPNEFSIGEQRFLVSYIYRYYPLDNKKLDW